MDSQHKFTVIIDTREQIPWDFSGAIECEAQLISTVKTGDYTIKGMEHILAIERKRTTGELCINFGKKWKPFEKELQRMSAFPHKYLVCEFPFNDVLIFPAKSHIPQHQWSRLRMHSKFLLKRLNQIENDYGIKIIYAGDKYNAEKEVLEIFKNVLNEQSI